jgi:hypothetical protein
MRRLCAGTCGTYFHPASYAESLCDDCAARAIDHEAGMICQDNKEPGDWLRPVDAMSLAKVRIENRKLIEELHRWKRFAGACHSTICAIAAPRLFPRDQQSLAEKHLAICEREYAEQVSEINGPVYGERRG